MVYTEDLCVSDIMPFWRSRPSGSDIGLCSFRPASLCLHAVGEFFVVTSDLKPDLLWVTSSCDSCDRLCTDAEKHFFGSPVVFSVSRWQEIHMKPLVSCLMRNIQYSAKVYIPYGFWKGKERKIPLGNSVETIKLHNQKHIIREYISQTRETKSLKRTEGQTFLTDVKNCSDNKVKSRENDLKRTKSQTFWQICQELKC